MGALSLKSKGWVVDSKITRVQVYRCRTRVEVETMCGLHTWTARKFNTRQALVPVFAADLIAPPLCAPAPA